MAGRVERRINDRFYFVLDEVGDSSGIESETVSSDEAMTSKEGDGYVISDCGNRDIDIYVSKATDVINDNNKDCSSRNEGAKTRDLKGDPCDKTQINTDSGSVNTGESLPASSDSNQDRPACQNSERVDMEIDSNTDGEIIEEKIEPIIRISFRDEKIEKSYKCLLLKYLTQKIHPCTVITNSENSLEIEVYGDETEKALDDNVLDFSLDTTPSSECYNSKVPFYSKNHDILLSDSSPTQTPSPKRKAPTTVCFNCCGDHVLRDCPHPKDLKGIHINRSKFQATAKTSKASRYHLDENQRFGDLVPGELSKNLRNALDLKKDQMPLFMYRMRILGYPPAWLEEARVSHSGVAVYDSNGVPIIEEDEEEGEIIPEGAKDRFDISKIIEFPGFNVPLPKHMKEEGKIHCCPNMSEEQSKENMIKALEPNAVQAYKKRSLTLHKYSSQEGTSEKRLPSPTIEEMEEKKRQLLIALDDADVTSDSRSLKNDDGEIKDADAEVRSETPAKKVGSVKNMDLGTPILKSISPYSKLPSREQFSVNVSDVINFENLPNSTGKYESMSSLILKIRDTASKRQNE
ncbi:UNVERIFIED_CONTAM: hypothetical protein PYX00_005526 [Menopon gallinae]|uniref:PSP proline-rich domain-containing protein n=1 Tax=Menopon gallinae TaxID=328185 RepID=A0AAW2HRU8_9NEOP